MPGIVVVKRRIVNLSHKVHGTNCIFNVFLNYQYSFSFFTYTYIDLKVDIDISIFRWSKNNQRKSKSILEVEISNYSRVFLKCF